MVEVKACRGEVASRLESARDVLNILTVSPVDKRLAGEVLALTMMLVGAWGGPRPPKEAPPGDLREGCAQESSILEKRGEG